MIITTNCWLNQVNSFFNSGFFNSFFNFFYLLFSNLKGWIDFKLKWDPKNYDGIESIHIPAERVWKPDILLGKFNYIFKKSKAFISY